MPAQALADEVTREDGAEDEGAGDGDEPPRVFDVVHSIAEKVAPGRVRRVDTEPEQAEPGFGEDRAPGEETRGDERGDERVRQEVP